MIFDNKIWVANDDKGEKIFLDPKYANRHGLIAGATGTGKTVTVKVLAESFSEMGVPVFLADVKGDLASIADMGTESENMNERIQRFGLAEAGFKYQEYPVSLWDLYGQKGIMLRTTISEMGPLLLARLMGLNDLQSDILSIVFKIADDMDLLLVDTKDLKAMLNYVSENNKEFEAQYGKMSPTSISAIVRALVALEIAGGEQFFSEPSLNITDWFTVNMEGKGLINVLDSESLISDGRMYSTFLLWLLSELFENLPEVGDLDKPKMVFFFDEAHLLFNDAPKVLLDKIEQVVKLIRSKGVGIYFCTQNPSDIPDGVLAQLGNKIQHALHAYTPADQKAVKAAAASFRENSEFDTYETIMALGTGEAVVSFLEEGGVPGICKKAAILPPKSKFGSIDDARREALIMSSILYSKYSQSYDPESAFELLGKKVEADAQAAEAAKQEAEAAKQAEKEAAAAAKQAEKEAAAAAKAEAKEKEREEREKKKVAASVGNSVAGTVGREAGKSALAGFGSLGKKIGGNAGAALGRGIFATLFKKC